MIKDNWPPKITLTPEGVAGLFLMSHCGACADGLAKDALVELFKLYWDDGFKSGIRKEIDTK